MINRLFNKNLFKISISLGLLLCGAAVAAVCVNLNALERNQIQQFKTIATKLTEMASNFVTRQQYDNLLALMQLQTQTNTIQYMMYYVNDEPVLQAGNEQHLDMSIKSITREQGKNPQIVLQGSYLYIDQVIPNPKEALDKFSVLRIVFSMKGFYSRKANILSFIAIIGLLILALAIVLYLLHQAQEKLKQEENTKTKMIKAIAHDALHYVTVIDTLGDNQRTLLKRSVNRSQVEELLNGISETNGALTKLLEELKYNEYLNRGQITNRPELVDLQKLIHTMMTGFKELLAKKQVTIEHQTSKTPLEIWADPGLIKRVVMNLLHNAFKHTRPRSVIRIWNQVDQNLIKIMICDQGNGIPKDQWETIMQPHIRLEDDTFVRPEDRRGTGLGLSNSRQIVQLYGGHLGVHASVVGKGTTFYFTLGLYAGEPLKLANA